MKGSNLSTLCSKEKRKKKIISKDRKKAGGTISTKVRTVRREGILGREKKRAGEFVFCTDSLQTIVLIIWQLSHLLHFFLLQERLSLRLPSA